MWEVFWLERGNKIDLARHRSEAHACFQLLGRLAYTQLAAGAIGRLYADRPPRDHSRSRQREVRSDQPGERVPRCEPARRPLLLPQSKRNVREGIETIGQPLVFVCAPRA